MKERRGFASMSPEKQRKVAAAGGRMAHRKGTGHEWTTDEAREAGRKGGLASAARRLTNTPDAGPDPDPGPDPDARYEEPETVATCRAEFPSTGLKTWAIPGKE